MFRTRMIAALAVAVLAGACASTTRQEAVAQRGSTVMPFDLSRTTHFFDDTAEGGVETVTANDPGDARQAALIRSHLSLEAERFARGDVSDPAAIHGADMPGLATLSRAGGKLRIDYREVPGGASLRYAGGDPAIVAAIHRWFAAQRSDHAAHEHRHHHGH